jgi:hypothetical protein
MRRKKGLQVLGDDAQHARVEGLRPAEELVDADLAGTTPGDDLRAREMVG